MTDVAEPSPPQAEPVGDPTPDEVSEQMQPQESSISSLQVSAAPPPPSDTNSAPTEEPSLKRTSSKDYYDSEDITTDEGKQQASMGETPLSLYLRQMGEMQMTAIEKMFTSAVEAPCSDPEMSGTISDKGATSDPPLAATANAVDDSCHPIAGCQQTIEYQLDVLTHCRQPLEFFPFLHNVAHHRREGPEESATVPLGMYTVPCSCEYCGASSTSACGPDCQRPKLYFKKKKPPFASPEKWDPTTEYEIEPNKDQVASPPVQEDGRRTGWMTGFFKSSTTQVVDSPAAAASSVS